MTRKIKKYSCLRLVLGDQLNIEHFWYKKCDPDVVYCLMELRSETDYVKHHVQKIIGFFSAMRAFAKELSDRGHHVVYLKLDDPVNTQDFYSNLKSLVKDNGVSLVEYIEPDEYRLEKYFREHLSKLGLEYRMVSAEHFFTGRDELAKLSHGKKSYRMEYFYREMRRRYRYLMDGDKPLGGKWNFDAANRRKLPANVQTPPPLEFSQDVESILGMVSQQGIKTIGTLADPKRFPWPVTRSQSLEMLSYFLKYCLPCFGQYEDAMTVRSATLYHSRLSFSLNLKLISPREVVEKAIDHFNSHSGDISLAQIEGFVRQILGWREYMRGMYWMRMPEFSDDNYFKHQRGLPDYYWDAKTKMNCMKHAIGQSLDGAYAHHIQRLMITGNFALLAGIAPDEVDAWYLGVYIDAIEWVELPNTRGMSQFADGGIIASKPYISSAGYIDKMSDYCQSCDYDKKKKYGDKACPFNSLYWAFMERHLDKLKSNIRMSMITRMWEKMALAEKENILKQASQYLNQLNQL